MKQRAFLGSRQDAVKNHVSFSQKWYSITLSLKKKGLSMEESGNICRRIVG